MKRNIYKKACISLLTVALLLPININGFVIHGLEITDSEESAVPVQQGKTEIEDATQHQKVPEVREKEFEKDTSKGIISSKIGSLIKDSLVRATNNAGSFHVTGDTGWNYSSGVLTFNTSGDYTITGDGIETQDRIVVADHFVGTITINNVNVNVSTTTVDCAFEVVNTAKMTLMLEGTNTLKSGTYAAGLGFSGATDGTLTIDSNENGSLTATGGGEGAGIGGGNGGSASNIIINGGIITATGSGNGAGIGGGRNGAANNITITGGNIIATSSNGAGIGAGVDSNTVSSNIFISGGTITAVSSGWACGIGHHVNGSSDNIIITGGSVKAKSGGNTPDIGVTPKNSTGQDVYLAKLDKQEDINSIKVDGADYKIDSNHTDDTSLYLYLNGENHIIEADNGGNKTKVNVKWDSASSEFKFIISVEVGAFYVSGGTADTDWIYDDATKILTFNNSGTYTVTGDGMETQDRIVVADNFEGTITINNVNINVSTILDACAFEVKNTANLTLMLEGANKLHSNDSSAGIEFNNAIDGTLTINSNTNGSLEAIGGAFAAGVGGGYQKSGDRIAITGGTINATSNAGAGIGGGNGGSASNITITGGTINATSNVGAGIGGGDGGSASEITIIGGGIRATSYNGAGIGGGYFGSADNININGGNITANSYNGAGIGGGPYGSADNININGGNITANSDLGAGIGGGEGGSASNIIIDGGSVKANSISIPPKNSTGDTVYLAKLDNQDGVSSVAVDGKDNMIASNHTSDTSLYLYLSGKDHVLTVEKSGTISRTMVKWENYQFIFIPFNAGSFDVTGGTANTDWVYDDATKILTFNNNGIYTVTGDGIETQDRIVVADSFVGTITINNVNINVSTISEACAFEVKNTAKLILMLEGTNKLHSKGKSAGLEFNNAIDGTLTINSNTNGSLEAIGGAFAAGVGGGYQKSGDRIAITGGTINATSNAGAGIGGGYFGSADNININGGNITANSYNGAGIGGGEGGSASNITITGGKIHATSNAGAGIGGGGDTSSADNIVINGGNIIANSYDGAGIGGGNGGSASNIKINGGTITATSENGYGVGSMQGVSTNLIINGGSVKASSIDVTPKNSNGNNVYLAKLDNQDSILSVIVDRVDYSINGNHPDNDTSFYLYLSGQHHFINSDKSDYGARWNGLDGFRWITSNSYTLTIPATVSADANSQDISIKDVMLMDVKQKVNVKVGNTSSTLDTNGNLTLKRSDHKTMKTTVTIDSTPIAPNRTMLAANDSEDKIGTMKFALVDPLSILAGTYTGILTFIASVE